MDTQTVGKFGISSDYLKIIAVVSMLIDHIGAVLIRQFLFDIWYTKDIFQEWYYNLYLIFRLIGRTAFPIYCYLLTESFRYTSNRAKYGLRLFVFCIISELPFDYGIYGHWTMDHQNVFFTLLTGYLVIWGIENIRQTDFNLFFKLIIESVILISGGALAYVFHTDYDAGGVVLIVCLYLFGQNYRYFTLLIFLIVLSLSYPLNLIVNQFIIELFSFPAFILIGECNHIRRLKIKYLYYFFYPVHFIILYGIGIFIKNMMI